MVTGVAVLTAATVVGAMGDGNVPLDVAVGVASVALSGLLLRWPVHSTVLLSLLAVLSPAATPAATGGAVVVAQRRRFPVAVGVGVVGLAAHLAQGLLRPAGGLSFGWWAVLAVCAYAA